MSLVDYQSSDEDSDTELTQDENPKSSIPTKNASIQQKRKEPVKIAIPALDDFDAEAEEPSKKPKLKSSSGLLSLLPAPKHSFSSRCSSLVPPSVKKKEAENKKVPNTSVGISSVEKIKKIGSDADITKYPVTANTLDKKQIDKLEEDEDEVLTSDFFSLDSKPSEVSAHKDAELLHLNTNEPEDSQVTSSIPHGENFVPSVSIENSSSSTSYSEYQDSPETSGVSHSCLGENYNPSLVTGANEPYVVTAMDGYTESSAESFPTDVKNDERFLRLQGKNKKGFDNINIIDVNVDSELPDKTQWLTKSLTEEKKVSFSRKKGEMPTQQQRRKHQITYLAFQAKERELDLKNQWAQNRLTRRETQSKYGF